jgi:ATP-dependent RNA helicase DDX19/DBP5
VDSALFLKDELTRKNHSVAALVGRLEPEQRDRVMTDFREGKAKVLIATNVLARGIDVLQVSYQRQWRFQTCK